jgi:hypothetical protein
MLLSAARSTAQLPQGGKIDMHFWGYKVFMAVIGGIKSLSADTITASSKVFFKAFSKIDIAKFTSVNFSS